MQTTAERVDRDRVKLRVEIPEEELRPALDQAYRRWSSDIRVPGFRKGKVPRQIIDSRVGPGIVREEAVRDALPDFYQSALQAEDLEAIAPPDIEVLEFEEGSPVVFEATVAVRPEVVVPELSEITVEAPEVGVTDADVDEQLERLRDRFAELETVGREARRGDFALIDLKGYHHEELVEGAGAPDYLYEIGSHEGPPRLDEELEGERPGAILKFTSTLPEGADDLAGRELSFTVLVKEVKAKVLPNLDDDFAKTVGEVDGLDALKEDLRGRLAEVKRAMVEDEIRGKALEALVDAAVLEAPERLVESEFEHRLHHFEEDLSRAGITMATYVQQAETTELELRSALRQNAARSVLAELLLEQVARDNEITVQEEDIGREVAIAAARSGRDAKEVAQEVVEGGRLGAVAADIMRRKALDHVVEHINVINRPVDEEE